MFNRSRGHKTEQQTHDEALLAQLLSAAPPPEAAPRPLRRVALRSQAEQRRIALRSFLQRTWFDRSLTVVERLLVIAMLGVFGYWLADGYGRDLWHSWQQRNVQAASAPTPLPGVVPMPPAIGGAVGAGAAAMSAGSLPFTTPDMELPAAPDYMVPGQMPAAPPPSDQRPRLLSIPTIGLETTVNEVFVQDGVWQVADYAAGYHHGTALPGEEGNTVMAGHAGLRGAVFRDLGALTVGQDIFVVAGGWRYRYRVREVTSVWPNQVEVMDATPTPVLTLITCTAWDTQRLVVVADLLDSLPTS